MIYQYIVKFGHHHLMLIQMNYFLKKLDIHLYQRTYTNITIESLFYVSNQQQPIARESEIIFRNLLFTIVLLELFGLLFLVIKLLMNPLFNIIYRRLQRLSKRNQVHPFKEDST
jgi:hypothetical protein